MWWTIHLDGGPRRVNHAAVSIGDKIYSFGGYCSGDEYDRRKDMDVFLLDTVTNRWYNLFEKRKRKSDQLVAKNSAKLVRRRVESEESGYMDSETASEDENPVNFVDFENEHPYLTARRECKSSPKGTPSQRYGHTVVDYDGLIYLWGGRNDQYGSSSTLHEFNPETLKWRIVPAGIFLPQARDGHSAVVYGNSMYIFGGFEYMTSLFSNDVYEFNFEKSSWSHIQTTGECPSPRDFHTSCTKEWTCIEADGDLPTGRRSHSMWTYNDKIYVFGGYESRGNTHFNDLYSFDPLTNVWTRLLPEGHSPCPRRRHCSCLVGQKVFIFGGTAPNKQKTKSGKLLIDLSDTHVLDYSASLKILVTRKMLESSKLKKRKLPYLGSGITQFIRDASIPNTLSSPTT
ncbi:hypothetical protein FO519_004467 [Halicephalobus sp. NKZ332]|nr:hypothetical protein FO519_004467 [Halicephalobus sp. NKZ332]